MAFFDGIIRQLRSVIEWEYPNSNDLFFQWSSDGDEIKNASKLIIGPGQGCIFVYQGKVISMLESEMMVDLKTDNIPFWTTISKVMQAFESEHKVGLYFYRKTRILDQKWGTTSSIKYNDPVYNFPVGLRAYGNFSFKITDPEMFFKTVVGSGYNFTVKHFRDVVNSRITEPLSDYLADMKYSYAEIDSKRSEMSKYFMSSLKDEFNKLGFDLTDFRIEGTSFDQETQKRINRISDLTAEAHAAKAAGMNYAQVQQLDALKAAAKNEGGGAGMLMGVGAGVNLGGNMVAENPFGTAQKAPKADYDPSERLMKLKKLLDNELISQQEYDDKKKQILEEL